MSDEMRAFFEADPEDKTDDSIKGRQILLDMEELITKRLRQRRLSKPPGDDLGQ